MCRAGGARRGLAQPRREDVGAARSVCDDGPLRSIPADSCADVVPRWRSRSRRARVAPSKSTAPFTSRAASVSVHVLEAVAARRTCARGLAQPLREKVGAARSVGEDGRLRSIPADSCADFVPRSRSQSAGAASHRLNRRRPSQAARPGVSVHVLKAVAARAYVVASRSHVERKSARLVLSVRMAAVVHGRVAHHSADCVLQGPVVRGLRVTAASCARGSRSARLTGCSHVERGRSAPRWPPSLPVPQMVARISAGRSRSRSGTSCSLAKTMGACLERLTSRSASRCLRLRIRPMAVIAFALPLRRERQGLVQVREDERRADPRSRRSIVDRLEGLLRGQSGRLPATCSRPGCSVNGVRITS